MTRRIYLDNNATTALHPEVKQTMIDYLDEYGNASSFHERGRRARIMIEQARQRIARFLGCEQDEIIFTSSGSESNNTVLNSVFCDNNCCHEHCTKQLVTSVIEHPSIWEPSHHFSRIGRQVSFVPVDTYGTVNRDMLEQELHSGPGLVSVMLANNEIGTIQPIRQLSDLAHAHRHLFHTDAVQAVGKVRVNVHELGVDMLTLSGHKLYGPKGIGILYVKKGTHFCPLIRGGHHEYNRRAGTENNLGIIALGKAVEIADREMEEEADRLLALKKKLAEGIINTIPDVRINGHPTDALPGTLNVSFSYIEGESILLMLDMEGVEVSTGSACASGSLEPSHVLTALGLDPHLAHGSIRFSLGRENTEEDIDYVLAALPTIISNLRRMSPLCSMAH